MDLAGGNNEDRGKAALKGQHVVQICFFAGYLTLRLAANH